MFANRQSRRRSASGWALVAVSAALFLPAAKSEVVGSVSGLVHDARGTPQIGATVALLMTEV